MVGDFKGIDPTEIFTETVARGAYSGVIDSLEMIQLGGRF